MDQFAFFFFEYAFCFADVDQRLEIAAVIIVFFFLTFFGDLIFIAARAIEQSLKWIRDEGHDWKERTNQRDQEQQSAFRISCRDKEWN